MSFSAHVFATFEESWRKVMARSPSNRQTTTLAFALVLNVLLEQSLLGQEAESTRSGKAAKQSIVEPTGLDKIKPDASPAQIRFVEPAGMVIRFQNPRMEFDDNAKCEVPCRVNCKSGQKYRLKLSQIAGRLDLELFPTIQIFPTNQTTEKYLNENTIDFALNDRDFDTVESREEVVKVLYLPDPKYAERKLSGIGSRGTPSISTTELDPGIDPIFLADQRGTVLAVMRIGTISRTPGIMEPAGLERPQLGAAPVLAQIRLADPIGMNIQFQNAQMQFDKNQTLQAPCRVNCKTDQKYRLKLTEIPGRKGLQLFPTVEVFPSQRTSENYLNDNAVDISLDDDDLDRVESGQSVVKIFYVPHAQFAERKIPGLELPGTPSLSSVHVDPGIDPIALIKGRGTILAVIRFSAIKR